MPVETVIQHRRGTAAAWTSANPVLADGEPGYETDTNKVKYGDGVTAWNSLPYFAGGLDPAVESELAYYFEYTAITDARPSWDGPVVWVDVNDVGEPDNWINGDYLQDSDSGTTGLAQANGEYAVNTVAASGATETLTLAPAHDVTMDQNCTFTFPTPTAGHTFLLRLSGAFTPTFPASVDWDSATAPTYATPSLYGFTTLDGGTTWVGTLIASGAA